MAIQDSNAERRNLTVLSMSIIIYYAAGGEFAGDVKLPLINLHFENQAVLAYFLWGILGWFLLRYWMVNKGTWQEAFRNEMTSAIPQRLIEAYLIKRYAEIEAQREALAWECRYSIITNNEDKIAFLMKKTTGQFAPSEQINPKGVLDQLYVALLSTYLFLTRPTLTAYFVPYIIALIAVVLGVTDWLQC